MMRQLLVLVALYFSAPVIACGQDTADRRAILEVLENQVNAWNQGNVEAYMQGYWPSDSLMFIGQSGITWGWQNTLDNYKKNYPGPEAMGLLEFTLLYMEALAPNAMLVVGQWQLHRNTEELAGHFTLVFKKIDEAWLITRDHSS